MRVHAFQYFLEVLFISLLVFVVAAVLLAIYALIGVFVLLILFIAVAILVLCVPTLRHRYVSVLIAP